MPPSPIPAPLPPWARTLLQVLPYITIGLQEVLQYIHEWKADGSSEPDEWRRIQIVWSRTGSTLVADHMITTLDVVNITGGNVDNSWTQGDHDAVNAQLNVFLNAMAATITSNITHVETRYYRMQYAPLPTSPIPPGQIDHPFVKSGAPVVTYPGIGAGTRVSAVTAPQTAISSTDLTPYRLHWGRNYWPGVAAADVSNEGHFTTALVDTLAANLETLYANWGAAEYFPVVTVTQINKAPARALLQVTGVQVDDVPDVVRRRRPRAKTYSAVKP